MIDSIIDTTLNVDKALLAIAGVKLSYVFVIISVTYFVNQTVKKFSSLSKTSRRFLILAFNVMFCYLLVLMTGGNPLAVLMYSVLSIVTYRLLVKPLLPRLLGKFYKKVGMSPEEVKKETDYLK